MIDKQKILVDILDFLSNHFNLTVKNLVKTNGYYLWDMGEDSVIHLEFEQIKNWKFGLWIVYDESVPDKVNISFFGNKKNWIDKFKPSRSPISSELNLKIEDLEDIDNYTWDLFYPIEKELYGLNKRRLFWEFFINSDGDETFVQWLFDEIWWGTIDPKLQKFYKKRILLPIAKLTAKLWKLRFHKYIHDCYVEDTSEKYYFEPCRLYITYADNVNESKYVNDKIQLHSLLFAFLNATDDWIGKVHVEHIHKDFKRTLYNITTYYRLT